jgi:hypothetical protein
MYCFDHSPNLNKPGYIDLFMQEYARDEEPFIPTPSENERYIALLVFIFPEDDE